MATMTHPAATLSTQYLDTNRDRDHTLIKSNSCRRIRPHTTMSSAGLSGSNHAWSKSGPVRSRSVNENIKMRHNSDKSTPPTIRRQFSKQLSTSDQDSHVFSKSLSTSALKMRPSNITRLNSTVAKTLHLDELGPRKKKTRSRLPRVSSRASTEDSQVKTTPREQNKDGVTPLQRFRKAARLVKLLVTVSNVCRDLLVYAIKDEQWYEFCEKFIKDASAGGTPVRKDTFMTTMKNPATKQFEQLEFDASEFKRDYHSGSSLLTNDIKNILCKRPGSRTPKEVDDCLKCIKRLVPVFGIYTSDQQKSICQNAMYDRYFQERVILREGLPPDGIYFVLNGTLLEKGEKMSTPKVIKPGDKFGEDDLKNGMIRQSNVVSKSPVDLLYLHKFDYEEIFDLTVDLSGDQMKVFDVCKDHLLFNYYPVIELVRNPARWQVLKFKYGRLIAANSCETEFIYIIRCGEARVIKYLQTKTINVLQRRRRLQEELDSSDPYSSKKKLLDFVSDNAMRSGLYSFNAFSARNPAAERSTIQNRVKRIASVPPDQRGKIKNESLSSFPDTEAPIEQVALSLKESETDVAEEAESDEIEKPPTFPFQNRLDKLRAMTAPSPQNPPALPKRPHTTKNVKWKKPCKTEYVHEKSDTGLNKTVPPFVQVDFLQAGAIYGMRSLLPLDQQGEPVSLVSAGCEVIQINRKFFAKYLDANMLGIVALKAKAYPSEDDLLKRLDVNLQWEEYCTGVMKSYLKTKIKPFRSD